ncbi:hypothetical protein GCM10009804_64250 [Kribbella hippodromi]|uniref:Heparinase II/III-like protein n=1 Tax=Kribbella hippodromi TaxID=434347 RepID=A0ABN2E7I2_9ACTN
MTIVNNPTDFDASLIRMARAAGDKAYDPVAGLIAEEAKYNPIHTKIWTGTRHSHRESVAYALVLLESGDDDDLVLAEQILDRLIAVQNVDNASPTYGLWSYYHEETLAEMVPPDWNWADFIGRDLAFVLLRHEARLTAVTRVGVRAALGHAARSIVRRNVAMSYTNIAAKGTFVTLAAGQLLGDDALTEYAVRRVARLREQVETAGSFAEYNSAVYWTITVEAIAAISTYIEHPEAVAGARWIVDKLWEHFAVRWHSRVGELSGPMARVYNDAPARAGDLLALVAKAVGFAGMFGELPVGEPSLSLVGPAVVDVAAPAGVVARVLDTPTGLVRERFSYAAERVPVVGTTWHGRNATVGSANVGEFWLQRRPLIGYWREADDPVWGPVRYAKLHVMKDGHDFSSAVFSSVQAEGQVLWSVGFISPGGDEHIGLHQIEAGQPFAVESLTLAIEFHGLQDARVTVGGRAVGSAAGPSGPATELGTGTAAEELGAGAVAEELGAGRVVVGVGEQVVVSTASVQFVASVDSVEFGEHTPRLSLRVTADRVTLEVELLSAGTRQLVLRDVATAQLTGTFSTFEPQAGDGEPGVVGPSMVTPGVVEPGVVGPGVVGLGVVEPGVVEPGVVGSGSTTSGVVGPGVVGPEVAVGGGRVAASWTTVDGQRLKLGASTRVGTQAEYLNSVESSIDNQPVAAKGLTG